MTNRNPAVVFANAARGVARARAATIALNLASLQTATPEDTYIGSVNVTGWPSTYRVIQTIDASGQTKIVNGYQLVAGPTASDYTLNPSISVGGLVFFSNGMVRSWSGSVSVLASIPVDPTPLLAPSAAWNGTARSGYTAANGYVGDVPPTDPTRTTAKPVMKSWQAQPYAFAADYPIGFRAGGRGGIQKIIVHYEGARYELTEQTVRTFTDPRGGPDKRLIGFWFDIDHSAHAVDGEINFYTETVPNDPAMQRRVQGPYVYYRRTTLYDKVIHVAPSLADVAGTRYNTLGKAIAYLGGQSTAHNNQIIIDETGLYNVNSGLASDVTTRKGTTKIQAVSGVTATVGLSAGSGATWPSMTPRYAGLEFYQDQSTGTLIIDAAEFEAITSPGGLTGTQSTRAYGIEITNSSGPYPLLNKDLASAAIQNPLELKFCYINKTTSNYRTAYIVGNTFDQVWGDLTNQVPMFGANIMTRCDPFGYRNDVNAFTATYTGPGTSATIAKTGTNGSAGTVSLVDSVNGTTTIQINNTRGSGIWTVGGIVSAINAVPGWVAVLQDNSRPSDTISSPGNKHAYGPVSAKSVVIQFITAFDVHMDYLQQATGTFNNAMRCENVCVDGFYQELLIGGSGYQQDICFLNEVHKLAGSSTTESGLIAQFVGTQVSHLYFEHCTMVNQKLQTRTGWVFDAYSANKNCLFRRYDSGNNAHSDGSHFMLTTAPSAISGGTSCTSGGTATSLMVDPDNSNFKPQGALLSNLVAANQQCAFDAYGIRPKPTIIMAQTDGSGMPLTETTAFAKSQTP